MPPTLANARSATSKSPLSTFLARPTSTPEFSAGESESVTIIPHSTTRPAK
jgi:hypothetical protein